MKNELMFNHMINEYNELSFTHEYMFGFCDRGFVYVATCEADMLPYLLYLDRTSSARKGEYTLRFKPSRSQKELLKMQNCYMLCSVESFKSECANSKYNRGEVFEKMMTERYGQTWEKDRVPFYMGSDLSENGHEWQIKFESATFCTETSLRNARK